MKILVICQYYRPEPLRTSDICEELVKAGHEVSVITDVPNYPMGYVYDGYKKGRNRNEVINGVKVHRCFTIARRKGIIFRFLNYYSFAISSKLYPVHCTASIGIGFFTNFILILLNFFSNINWSAEGLF